MVIQIDSREKQRAIKQIIAEFEQQGIKHPISKLLVGDYMNYDNPRLIIDRKQNLLELCSNIGQGHERFRRELQRAQENEIKLIILVEHGENIQRLADVIWWQNPRRFKWIKDERGRRRLIETKAMQGETVYKILCTLEKKYGCQFLFCKKEETGKRIVELLRNGI